jgi:hypothetical protein
VPRGHAKGHLRHRLHTERHPAREGLFEFGDGIDFVGCGVGILKAAVMFMPVVTVAPAGSAIESAAQSMVDDLNVVAADAGTYNLTSILSDMR